MPIDEISKENGYVHLQKMTVAAGIAVCLAAGIVLGCGLSDLRDYLEEDRGDIFTHKDVGHHTPAWGLMDANMELLACAKCGIAFKAVTPYQKEALRAIVEGRKYMEKMREEERGKLDKAFDKLFQEY